MVRRSWRSWRRIRPVVLARMRGIITPPPSPAARIRRRNASSRSSVPAAALTAAGVSSAIRSPSRISSSRSQRLASSITWLETSSVVPSRGQRAELRPQLVAQHRVLADGRLVEHQQLGLADHRAGQRGPAALAAGEGADELVGGVGEPDVADRLVGVGRAEPVERGEVAGVLPHRQVGVDAGRLGEVADLAPQRRRDPAGSPEHGDRAGLRRSARRRWRASGWSCRCRWARAAR